MITSDIKDKAVISYGVHGVKKSLHLMKVAPICRSSSPVPVIQCILSVRVLLKKRPERTITYDDHMGYASKNQRYDNFRKSKKNIDLVKNL
jgi:hypothetical protein